MYLANQLSSLWDEESWTIDSGYASSLYKIEENWVSYGQFSGYDPTDYYQITPGIGSFALVVTSDPSNNFAYPGTWGRYSFDVKITNQFGTVILDVSNSPDLYTDQILFLSNTNATYYVEIRNSVYAPTFNYAATLLRTAGDTTPPYVIGSSPTDEASDVSVNTNVIVGFSEAIQRGTGSIILKTATGLTVQVFDAATSSNLSISGTTLTINPTSDLAFNTSYIVEFSTDSIRDLAGNSYAGSSLYNFTTGSPIFIIGTAGDDIFHATAGNSWIQGYEGRDSLVFSSQLAGHSIRKISSGYEVIGSDGIDTIYNVERVGFSDKTINLTTQALAATMPLPELTRLEELYVAFFNRVPDADGLSFWIEQSKAGMGLNAIADAFYAAGVHFSALSGYSSDMTNENFVNVVYRNVLGRADGGDAEGVAFWSGRLANGEASRGSLVSAILDSAHSFKGRSDYGWVADLLDNKIEVANLVAVQWGLNYNTSESSISNGMAIAAAVTPTSIAAAIALVGIDPESLVLV